MRAINIVLWALGLVASLAFTFLWVVTAWSLGKAPFIVKSLNEAWSPYYIVAASMICLVTIVWSAQGLRRATRTA